MVSHNQVGASVASTTTQVKTMGGLPRPSPLEQFMDINISSALTYPKTWVIQGCPITHFLVEYKPQHQAHWLQGDSLKPFDIIIIVWTLSNGDVIRLDYYIHSPILLSFCALFVQMLHF